MNCGKSPIAAHSLARFARRGGHTPLDCPNIGTGPKSARPIFNPFHQLQLASELHHPKARTNMFKTWMKRGVPLSLALAWTCLAQDTAPLKLTLKDAVGLALKQNPQVILANLQVSQSQQDRLLAR